MMESMSAALNDASMMTLNRQELSYNTDPIE